MINLLGDLADGYLARTDYIDGFNQVCMGTIFRHDPENLWALMTTNNCLFRIIQQHKAALDENGLPEDEFLQRLMDQLKDVTERLEATGYTDTPRELYEEWIRSIEEEVRRRKENGLRIK